MPQVSVIVPSYQHEQFLSACLESVKAQTFQDWELIVVDDGSKDGSVALARSFADSDDRIKVTVNEKNLGTYGTLNEALNRAVGEFVAVLNSDDVWHPEKLERQVELMSSHPELPLCYVLGWKIDENGKVDESEDVHSDWPVDAVQDVLPRLLEENRILASGVLFRRDGLRFQSSLRYSGDWVALLRAAGRSLVGCVPERLTYWRVHGRNSHLSSVAQVREEARVRNAIVQAADLWSDAPHDPGAIRTGLAACSRHLSALYVYLGDRASAREAASNTIRLGGPNRSSIKRWVSTLLPLETARRHLWPGAAYPSVAERAGSNSPDEDAVDFGLT